MLSPRFFDAFNYTTELHARQVRKGKNVPYLAHLMAVTSLVLENGGTEDEAIAALLHDAIEDQGHNFPGGANALRREIEERFGTAVLAIVEACTDADAMPKPPWKERKVTYINHLLDAPAPVLLVSCADKLHNARAILRDYHESGDEVWARFTAGKPGVLWYYRALVTSFRRNPHAPEFLTEELDRTVTTLEELTRSD